MQGSLVEGIGIFGNTHVHEIGMGTERTKVAPDFRQCHEEDREPLATGVFVHKARNRAQIFDQFHLPVVLRRVARAVAAHCTGCMGGRTRTTRALVFSALRDSLDSLWQSDWLSRSALN